MALENKILARLEPSIELEKFNYRAYKEEDGKAATSRDKGIQVPFVSINGYDFSYRDIKTLNITVGENIVPTIDLTIIDSLAQFTIDTYPRDGDVISVRLGSKAKDTYKDIRIDFDIESVVSPLRSNIEMGIPSASRFSFSGKMKIPGLFAETCKSYGVGTTIDHLENIATDLKLGLATNVDVSDDSMNLFVPYDPMINTIENLVKHSYVSDDSFQTFCIDPYYYINFVDINSLLNGDNSTQKAIAALDMDMNESLNEDLNSEENSNKMLGDLIISSHARFEGTNIHISKYSIKNEAGRKVKKNGYKRILQFFENDSENKLVNFDIEPLTSTNLKDIEAPLKGRANEERYKEEIKYKYVGRRDSDNESPNTHINYEFASIHNRQNLEELEKLQLEVQLSSINHAISIYQRIPVLIFQDTTVQKIADYNVKLEKEKQGFETTPKEDFDTQLASEKMVLNEFLSGFYVVGKITYSYKESEGIVKQNMTLLRREWPGRINNMG